MTCVARSDCAQGGPRTSCRMPARRAVLRNRRLCPRFDVRGSTSLSNFSKQQRRQGYAAVELKKDRLTSVCF
eukprot:983625-Pyramimonas_sp.AAC.1